MLFYLNDIEPLAKLTEIKRLKKGNYSTGFDVTENGLIFLINDYIIRTYRYPLKI